MTYTTTQRKKWAAYAAKTSMLDASRKFGVSTTAIRSAMKSNGVKPRRRGTPGTYTPAQIGRALALVAMSAPAAEILSKTGIPAKYARELARKLRVIGRAHLCRSVVAKARQKGRTSNLVILDEVAHWPKGDPRK